MEPMALSRPLTAREWTRQERNLCRALHTALTAFLDSAVPAESPDARPVYCAITVLLEWRRRHDPTAVRS